MRKSTAFRVWFLPETLKNTHRLGIFDRLENGWVRFDIIQKPTWSSYDDALPALPSPHLWVLRLSAQEELHLESL
jgi:hypothetical protein